MSLIQNVNNLFLPKDRIVLFYKKKVEKLDCINMPVGKLNDELLFVTISYNNANVIKHQIRLIKKNITDKHFHIVVDNSTNKEIRDQIKKHCMEGNVAYVSLHENPFSTGSASHAVVLNWAFRQLVLRYTPKIVGFIDHDIYPVKPHRIGQILSNQPFYGLLQEREDYWYLWPGFCFFTKKIYMNSSMDFMPRTSNGIGYDTGGALYNSIYHSFEKSTLKFPAQTYENIREGEVFQSDKMEVIDNWVHSFNGSYWMEVKDKEEILDKVLNDYYNS